jgi:hypothetical protein
LKAPQPQLHTPTQPTVKGNELNTSKGLQSNAPTGGGNATGGGGVTKQVDPTSPKLLQGVDQTNPAGGNTTGGGVKVLQGTPGSPQANPGGGITTGEAETVDLKALLNMLQGATPPPGGSTSPRVTVTLETIRDLLQQSKAAQPSPPSGGTTTGGEAIGSNNPVAEPPILGGGNSTGGGAAIDPKTVINFQAAIAELTNTLPPAKAPPTGGVTTGSATRVEPQIIRNYQASLAALLNNGSEDQHIALARLDDLPGTIVIPLHNPNFNCVVYCVLTSYGFYFCSNICYESW